MSPGSTGTIEARQLRRSRSDRTLAGVCGGLAAYFEIHPAVFRVAFVVLTLMGGAGIPIYLAAALVMPDEGKEDSFAAAALRRRRHRPWLLIALGLVAVVAARGCSRSSPVWRAGDAWALPARRRRPRPLAHLVCGRGRPLGAGCAGSGSSVASVAVLLLVLVAAFLATFDVHLGDGVDERTFAPASVDDLRGEYVLGIGELVLDLRARRVPARRDPARRARRRRAGSACSSPRTSPVRASADAKLGEIDLLGRRVEGWEVERAGQTRPALRVLVLDASVGIGEIEIERGLR